MEFYCLSLQDNKILDCIFRHIHYHQEAWDILILSYNSILLSNLKDFLTLLYSNMFLLDIRYKIDHFINLY